MGFSYLTGWKFGQTARNVSTAIGAAGAAYYLGRNIYKDWRRPRSRYYPKPNFIWKRQYDQYNRFISGRRRFRVRKRARRGRRTFYGRTRYLQRYYGHGYGRERFKTYLPGGSYKGQYHWTVQKGNEHIYNVTKHARSSRQAGQFGNHGRHY